MTLSNTTILVQEFTTPSPQDNMQDTSDESDETLSLCDLPLYNDHQTIEWKQDSPSPEQDFFEFCSQELSPPATGFPPESIIFCGKHISHKKEQDSSKLIETKEPTNTKKKHGFGVLRWAFCWSKDRDKSTTTLTRKHQSKNMFDSNKHGKGYGLPVHEFSILSSSSSGKARWYHLFWVSRFPCEVELKDMKNRLSRRPPHPPPPTGLMGLIRVLSCGSNHHPSTMVVASTSFSQRN